MLRSHGDMRRLQHLLCLLGALLLHAVAALADEPAACPPSAHCETPATSVAATPRSSKTDAPTLAVLGHLGIATPVGAAGLSLDLIPIRYLAIEAGVGSNFEGPEFEAA